MKVSTVARVGSALLVVVGLVALYRAYAESLRPDGTFGIIMDVLLVLWVAAFGYVAIRGRVPAWFKLD